MKSETKSYPLRPRRNFPGVGRSRGAAIVADMRAQAQRFFTEVVDDVATAVDVSARPFTLAHALLCEPLAAFRLVVGGKLVWV